MLIERPWDVSTLLYVKRRENPDPLSLVVVSRNKSRDFCSMYRMDMAMQ